ncbi:MAG: carboxypeptidase regulatory-like domain-containing protein [bacterium]
MRKYKALMFIATILSLLWSRETVLAQGKEMWITQEELQNLPTSGPAWNNLKAEADRATGTPNVSNQEDEVNVRVMAKALVYARSGDESYRNEVIDACMKAIDTEKGGRTLALGRELAAYVISADLVGLPADKDQRFRAWLRETLTESLSGRTLQSTHEDRGNNWGTHAGASRAAVAVYLGDQEEIERTAQVFKGWLGDRASYAGFTWGALSWQADPDNPVGINPKGATRDGHSIDGVLPDDQRRNGGFKWPPPKANYVYGALQGVLAQAVILYRAGYDVWNWEDKAMLRAFEWLHNEANFPATGDDEWTPHVINYFYGASFPAKMPAQPGKNVAWTDWTFGTGSNNQPDVTSVSGVVENSANRQPITNALVQLKSGRSVRYETQTGSTGRYHFNNIAAGSYELYCSKNGFQDWSKNITVADGQQLFGQNMALIPVSDSIPPDPPKNVRVVGGSD